MRRLTWVGVILATVAAGGASAGLQTGSWRVLPPAPTPAATSDAVAVWTGRELVVFGRRPASRPWSRDVAAAYDPKHRRWSRLSPFAGPKGNFEGTYHAVWTGRQVLVLGPFDFQAFDPRTARWRKLPLPRSDSGAALGLVVWTGRELISWGGGCCGDASRSGVAYVPATNRWHALPPSPLAPAQGPSGAWTGSRLIVVVSGSDPDGHAYPQRLARAAAFDPAAESWQRITPPPSPRAGAATVWTGSELLLVGGAGPSGGRYVARTGFAYDPHRNTWRRLPPLPRLRPGFAAIWAAGRVLLWGGDGNTRGAQYPPAAGRWFDLPRAPLRARDNPAAAWTGSALIVWGGSQASDGAMFTL